ncbi:MAG: ferrous iron transport protein B [Coprobacillus sp.]|nr:ferrous iron transport protein B [Coprobacillus sp.]
MRVALVGNQNSGKTTLFNDLTGSNQKIGNWPGVTIERKEGHIRGTDIVVVDLPGIYSLSPYTAEEEISRQYVVDEKPDVIIDIIDSLCIERSLYLVSQLIETGTDVILALNMSDIIDREGVSVDVEKLSKACGCSAVSISAKTKSGIPELIEMLEKHTYKKNKGLKIFPKDIETLIGVVQKEPSAENRFDAIKIIEKDPRYAEKYVSDEVNSEIENIETKYDMDSEQLIASLRYDWISDVKGSAITLKKEKRSVISDKLDKVFLNKWAAIPLFIVIMAVVYILAVGLVGSLTVDVMDGLINGTDSLELNLFGASWEFEWEFTGLGPWLADLLGSVGASGWAQSLVADGIIAGVGAILNFVPQIIILFLCLSVLESTGYLSRVAFLLDRLFHRIGLNGKSLIPFIVGTGCSVPAIMSARTIEDEHERNLTITLTPFMPCSAKLPIISLFAQFFFPASYAWLVTFLMYIAAIVVIILCAWVLSRVFIKNRTASAYISELPAWKAPNGAYVGRDVFDKTMAFIKRAGTIILLCSIVVWFLVSFTWDFHYIEAFDPEAIEEAADVVVYTVDDSLLANLGRAISWIFYPMLGGNLSWAASVSAIQGLVAKEQVISSMAIIARTSEEAIFESSLFSFFTPWSAVAYMTFTCFSAPCFGAISTMRKEFGSSRQMWKAIGFQTGLAWVLASIIGLIGMAFV